LGKLRAVTDTNTVYMHTHELLYPNMPQLFSVRSQYECFFETLLIDRQVHYTLYPLKKQKLMETQTNLLMKFSFFIVWICYKCSF